MANETEPQRCPVCGCPETRLEEWDHGVDRDTGYHDVGWRLQCAGCREVLEDG